MHEYHYGRLLLRSALELPELCPATKTGPPTSGTCTVTLVDDGLDPDFVAEHTDSRNGLIILRQASRNGYITLRLDLGIDFVISPERDVVTIRHDPATPLSTIRHNLLDQALPRILDGQGQFIVHASGVETQAGGILFLGDSGTGKSSLAAELARSGHRLLGDDCFVLEHSEQKVSALSTYPSLRLLPDSIDHFYDDAAGVELSEVAADRTKQRVGQDRLVPPVPAALSCLFLIDHTLEHQGPAEVHEVSRRDAMIRLVKNSFRLDPTGRGAQNAMDAAETIVRRIPMYDLRYERRYDHFDQVKKQILSVPELGQHRHLGD